MTDRKLRILSVVTLVTPLGEYGGPVRVAVNQARALRELGHDVTIAGGARGFNGMVPDTLEGVPAVLMPVVTAVPRVGFAGLASPRLWRWLRRHVSDFDVVHVHLARDFITLAAAHLARRRDIPYVLQPHGMVDASNRPLARPLDARWTRPVLRDAQHVLYLSEAERLGIIKVAGEGLGLVPLPNGVPTHDQPADHNEPTVLYLARIAPRKRPRFFVEMARCLSPAHPGARFVMVGPDEGEGPGVRADIFQAQSAGVLIEWKGALAPEDTLEEMQRAAVFVLPSVNEPNGMSVLEAMSVGLPVVITDTCGLAGEVVASGGGIVVNDTIEGLVDAVDGLLKEPDRARYMGARGREHVRAHLGMPSIAHQLESLYLE